MPGKSSPHRLSVVITTYNRAALLEECLQSVLAQTRLPDEIVVVDDGSTDGTAALVQQYAAQISGNCPLIYQHQKNAHISAARNQGLAIAQGEWILFLDDDDRLLPSALERLEKRLARDPHAVLVYGRAQIIGSDGAPLGETWRVGNEATQTDLWAALARQNFIRTPGCVLMRARALATIGGWDANLRSVEDWDVWLRLARAPGARFVREAAPVLQYRVHESSLSADRATMYATMRQMYRKHLDALADDPRAGMLAALLDKYPPLPPGVAPPEVSDDPQSGRHRLLRNLIVGLQIAPLYRRLPFWVRVRVGRVFGIDPLGTRAPNGSVAR